MLYANEDYICWRKTTTAISESTPDSESLNDIPIDYRLRPRLGMHDLPGSRKAYL